MNCLATNIQILPQAPRIPTESVKRIHELYMYDVLRADRCISKLH